MLCSLIIRVYGPTMFTWPMTVGSRFRLFGCVFPSLLWKPHDPNCEKIGCVSLLEGIFGTAVHNLMTLCVTELLLPLRLRILPGNLAWLNESVPWLNECVRSPRSRLKLALKPLSTAFSQALISPLFLSPPGHRHVIDGNNVDPNMEVFD